MGNQHLGPLNRRLDVEVETDAVLEDGFVGKSLIFGSDWESEALRNRWIVCLDFYVIS